MRVTVRDASRGAPSDQIAISVDPRMTASVGAFVGEYAAPLGGAVLVALLLALFVAYALHRARRRA